MSIATLCNKYGAGGRHQGIWYQSIKHRLTLEDYSIPLINHSTFDQEMTPKQEQLFQNNNKLETTTICAVLRVDSHDDKKVIDRKLLSVIYKERINANLTRNHTRRAIRFVEIIHKNLRAGILLMLCLSLKNFISGGDQCPTQAQLRRITSQDESWI